MKYKMSYLFIALMGCSLMSCDKNKGNDEVIAEYPLKSIELTVDGSIYHARIDQEKRTAVIGGIEYGSLVSDVKYKLASGSVISPDPSEYVNEWPRIATFKVENESESVEYTLELTAYKGQTPDESVDPEKLLFEDRFEQSSAIPDPEKWSLCKRSSPAWAKYLSESYDQVYVEDGKLVVKAEIVNGLYKTGGIETIGKHSFKNARVEVNARFVKTAKGGWPAIWMMPQNPVYSGWPDGGEIDIMEQLNHDTYVYQTVHNHYKNTLGNMVPKPDVTANYRVDQFNTYAVDLTDDALVFYVNGQETLRYANLHLADEIEKKQWPYSTDFYLILNYALGGADTWPGVIIDGELPGVMEIDWVRVTKL